MNYLKWKYRTVKYFWNLKGKVYPGNHMLTEISRNKQAPKIGLKGKKSSTSRHQTLLISYHRITYELITNVDEWEGLSQMSHIIYKSIERISA